MPEYTVKKGDCIESIAYDYGFLGKTIWDDPANKELREKRKDPNVLYPGDKVFIPDKRLKQETCETEHKYRFRKKGVPLKIRLRLFINNEPRVNEPYKLLIDGNYHSGYTDLDGKIEHPIPPNAKNGKLFIGEEGEEYILDLGQMDPINEISGIQARLNNLGFDCGAVSGILDSKTKEAIKKFQKKYDLKESGELDKPTADMLLDLHDNH